MNKIHPIPAFSDNYIWAIYNDTTCVVVDPGDADVVIDFLAAHQLHLDSILITHHHPDHTGGIEKLKQKFPDAHVYGPKTECIPHCQTALSEGDKVSIDSLDLKLNIFDVPGHTAGHIAYYNDAQLFCGDTLFSGGCGRLFEGTAEQLHHSLQKFTSLPRHTKVYCTHEYTLGNLAFAKTIEPKNQDLLNYEQHCQALRQQDVPTLPSSIDQELKINPFLRCEQDDVIAKASHLGATSKNATDVFSALRTAKDNF